jgi:hypothetical protein
MGKSRMMGAGLGSSSLYKSNPNVNTFGGDKKQGLPISVGLDPWSDRASRILSIGTNRNKLFIMNQLGGVGVGRSMFNVYYTNKDGVRKNSTLRSDTIYISNVVAISNNDPIPPDYVFYGIDNSTNTPNTVNFILKDPNSCVVNGKNYLCFNNTNFFFPITIESNQNFIMTYETFKDILLKFSGEPLSNIDLFLYAMQNLGYTYLSTQATITCT